MSDLGVVFPGQGSQAVGMLADLAEAHGSVAERFAEASEAIDVDLWAISQNGPAERLNQTEITQPALLTASIAIWDLIAAAGVTPAALAGHSLGEYSALVAAQSLGFADAVRLVHRRGQLMQQAVPLGEGAMAAILGLDNDAVAEICSGVEGVVTPANYNAPGQLVIAGSVAAVGEAAERCKTAGARNGP